MLKYEEDNKFDRLRYALCYWMAYQVRIDREKLLEEGSMRYALADAITSRDISAQRIELERVHPLFKNKKMDVYLYDKQKIKYEEAYELKLAKDETINISENKRIFNDILRLYFLSVYTEIKGYFIICGPKSNYKVEFVGDSTEDSIDREGDDLKMVDVNTKDAVSKIKSSGFYSNLFKFYPDGEKTITVNRAKGEFKDLYDDFISGTSKYEFKDELKSNVVLKKGVSIDKFQFKDLISFKTRCISHSNIVTDNSDLDYYCGIWEIVAI